jgi:hypothetical protein
MRAGAWPAAAEAGLDAGDLELLEVSFGGTRPSG